MFVPGMPNQTSLMFVSKVGAYPKDFLNTLAYPEQWEVKKSININMVLLVLDAVL